MEFSRETWEDAERVVLDEETGLTVADLWEWEFGDAIEIY